MQLAYLMILGCKELLLNITTATTLYPDWGYCTVNWLTAFPGEMDEETEEQRISDVIVFQFLRIIIATNFILCYLPLDLTAL